VPNPPFPAPRAKGNNPIQKQLWSFLVGLITVVMLIAGKSKALMAMQTCIVALGLPNTFQTCVICYAVKLAFDMELHADTVLEKTVSQGRYNKLTNRDNGMEFWGSSLFRPFKFVDYLITITRSVPGPTQPPALREVAVLWTTMTLFPFYWVGVCSIMCDLEITDPSKVKLLQLSSDLVLLRAQGLVAVSFVFFVLFIGLMFASISMKNTWVLGLVFYVFFVCAVALVRAKVATTYNLYCDVGRNLIAAGFFYSMSIAQMYFQLQLPRPQHAVR